MGTDADSFSLNVKGTAFRFSVNDFELDISRWWLSPPISWVDGELVSLSISVSGPNSLPAFSGEDLARSVAENSLAGTNVGAPVTAADPDGGTPTHTLEGTDAASFEIDSGSGQIQTKSGVSYDFETKSSYSVTVKAEDSAGGTDTVALTITVTDVNEPPSAPRRPHRRGRLGQQRQPGCDLDGAGQRRQARHRLLRPALPARDERGLDRRPAG